jgi:hypothetical protein
MAVPLEEQGTVKVFIEEDKKYSNVIRAHQSQLGAIELNYTGNKLATASEKGNVVRIFNTFSGTINPFRLRHSGAEARRRVCHHLLNQL